MIPMLAAVVPAASPFAQAFTGSWNCSARVAASSNPLPAVHFNLVIAPAADSRNWTIIRNRPQGMQGSTAYVGYVKKLRAWLYDDFQDNGTYVHLTSSGPHGGTWAWHGTFYTPDAQLALGPILWSIRNHRLERRYEHVVAGRTGVAGVESCAKE